MLLLQQMCVFLIIMFLGYFLAKKGKLDEHTTDNVSWIVVNVCNPCLILEAACRAVFGTWGFFRTMHGKTAPSC